MTVLRISLLGGFQLAPDGRSSGVKVTRIIQALLAYLLLNRHRMHAREVLAGIFWGDHTEERARSCLSTALWRLRRVLEPEGVPRGTYLVTTPTGQVGFNRASEHWLDVAVFEEQADQALEKPIYALEDANIQKLECALQLYTGDLLEGFYEDWALRERERMRLLYLNSLAHLMHYHRHHGAYEQILACGQKILHHDPLREEIHREMMRLRLENGQRALAVRQYEVCRRILDTELGITPMEETQVLYMRIMSGDGNGRVQMTSVDELTHLRQVLQELRKAVQGFEDAQVQLQQAIHLVERYAENMVKDD